MVDHVHLVIFVSLVGFARETIVLIVINNFQSSNALCLEDIRMLQWRLDFFASWLTSLSIYGPHSSLVFDMNYEFNLVIELQPSVALLDRNKVTYRMHIWEYLILQTQRPLVCSDKYVYIITWGPIIFENVSGKLGESSRLSVVLVLVLIKAVRVTDHQLDIWNFVHAHRWLKHDCIKKQHWSKYYSTSFLSSNWETIME